MARRGRNEGTISQRKDGRWEGRITFWVDGQRRRRSFYGRTRAEVAHKLHDAIAALGAGVSPPPEKLTLAAHLKTWLADKKARLRPESWRRYNDICRLYLIPSLGKKRLTRLTVDDVKELHATLAARGLSSTTCAHSHGVLRAALQDALRWGLVARNVASLISAPRRSTQEMRHLTAQDARDLLAAAEGEPLEAFFVLALTAGLREGELQALRWKDVDLERRRLRVVATLNTIRDGRPVFAEPKTQHSRRTVWLTERAALALERHHALQQAQRTLAGDVWLDYGLVFCDERGAPLWRSQIRPHWLRLLAKAGLSYLRIHDLRHSAATLLLAQGVPVKVVSEMLGHSDVATTLRIYAHVVEGAQAAAVDVMDRLLSG